MAEDIADDALVDALKSGRMRAGLLTHREHLRVGWVALKAHTLPGD
jgi:hypothetical protein